MALTLSNTIKNKIARRLYNADYSGVSTYNQALIDNEGASALTEIEQAAQWFTFTSGTGAAPDEWEPWFVDEAVYRCTDNSHPERDGIRYRRVQRAKSAAMATYSPVALSVTPSSSEAFVHNTLNNRKYVINHCARLSDRSGRPAPLYPNPHTIDAALDECLTMVWNKSKWPFARRPVTMTIRRTAFASGTYSHAAKTITVGSPTFTASYPAGTAVYITGGTGATAGEYVNASNTTTVLTLAASIGSGADAQTDIAGFVVTVEFNGLEASESYDSLATGRWVYTDDSGIGAPLAWATADEFAARRALDQTTYGRPAVFRMHSSSGTTQAWRFSPPPDQDYTVRGEVLVQQAADPTSTTDTGPFVKFATEFMPTIRRMQLARVLTNHGRSDDQLNREVLDELESLFPVYQDQGDMDVRVGVTDVYGDVTRQNGWNELGGGI